VVRQVPWGTAAPHVAALAALALSANQNLSASDLRNFIVQDATQRIAGSDSVGGIQVEETVLGAIAAATDAPVEEMVNFQTSKILRAGSMANIERGLLAALMPLYRSYGAKCAASLFALRRKRANPAISLSIVLMGSVLLHSHNNSTHHTPVRPYGSWASIVRKRIAMRNT